MLDVILGVRKPPSAPAVRGALSEYGFAIDDMDYWESVGAFRETTSGLRVNHISALSHPAFWQSVFMIANDVAGLNYRILREEPDGDFIHDPDHAADYLISEEANEDSPTFEALRLAMVHAVSSGNGYLHIERGMSGQPVNLVPLYFGQVWPMRDGDGSITKEVGGLYYKTYVDGKQVNIMASDMIHIKGLQLWAEFGVDPVTFHRDLIGLGQSAFTFASQFYRRGGRAGGILMVPPGQTAVAQKSVEDGFKAQYENPAAHFKTLVMRDGYKFEATTMSPQESQMTESRAADARDFARVFNLPPTKLGLPDVMGFKSLEQVQKQYFQQALFPWVKSVGGQFRLRLLTKGQRYKRSHKIGVDVSSIIQLDEEALNRILALQRTNLIITANEWRQKVNLPVSDDPEADRLVNPNTTAPDSGAKKPAGAPDEAASGQAVSDRALARLVNDTAKRMLTRLCNDARHRASSPSAFLAWLEKDLGKHRSVIEEVFGPVAAIVAEARGLKAQVLSAEWAEALLSHVFAAFDKYTRPPHAFSSLAINAEAEATRLLAGQTLNLFPAPKKERTA